MQEVLSDGGVCALPGLLPWKRNRKAVDGAHKGIEKMWNVWNGKESAGDDLRPDHDHELGELFAQY